MKGAIRLSEPVDCGDRIIVPLLREMALVGDHGGMVAREPVGLVILENQQAWFVSLSDGVTLSVIDDLFGSENLRGV